MASTSTSVREDQAYDPFAVLDPPNKKMRSSVSAKRFDVFINHRGPETKANLALPIYNSLKEAGIYAYLDCKETQLGDSISPAIKNAIFSATVHIAIFSPRYVESVWCLVELALMFRTKARIIPLFYKVEPSDFHHIINKVAEAFSNHEKKGRYPDHDIQLWKDCLQNVSRNKGYRIDGQNDEMYILRWLKDCLQKVSQIMGYRIDGQDDDLNNLCCEVVSAVRKEKGKRKIPLEVAKYEVGLDELVNDFQFHCQSNGDMRDKIIGIYGMGGSGKTTLAKYFFNRKHSEFSKSSFLFDVRENDVKGALTSLQKQLLADLFSEEHHSFNSTEHGVAEIKDKLQKSRESGFLIVIDDADHQKQLEALVPMDALNTKSLVIVTTRDERLLIKARVRFSYKMEMMSPEHSKELFCLHAFNKKYSNRGFENSVDSFVKACGGLPLALRVLGGLVFGSEKIYWSLQLDVVTERQNKDIKEKLKISYDTLEEDQKQIFMDVACFFIGKEVSFVMSIWKASKWSAEHALQTLKDKCLLELQLRFDEDDDEPRFVLGMHDQLRDLGRDLADNMRNPCRLWRRADHTEIQSIIMAAKEKNFRYFHDSPELTYLLEISNTSTDCQWLQMTRPYGGSVKDIPEWISLENLQSLRLKGVSPGILWQRDDQVSLKLKELYIFNCPSDQLGSRIGMLKHLETLYLKLWDVGQTLDWNCFLRSLTKLTNLKTMTLNFSKGDFALSNRDKTSDDDLFPMRCLETLTLSYGLFRKKLSISGQFCPALKSLKLDCMNNVIKLDLTGVTTLECLALVECVVLRKVLCSDLVQLEMVRIKRCYKMSKLPNFGRFRCLKRIYINDCRKLEDISAIERLKGLKKISIFCCPKLKNIKAIEQLKGLNRIWIEWCTWLKGVICFEELKGLKRIFIGNCVELQGIQGIESLIFLESIIIAACPKLQEIRGIEQLKGLKEMIISDTPSMTCIVKSQRLPSELTILVGRPAKSDKDSSAKSDEDSSPVSFLNADEIGRILLMADDFCETRNGILSKEEVEETIHSFHIKTQNSLSTLIFCAMLEGHVLMKRDICNGTEIVIDGSELKEIELSSYGEDWIYMCVVNEERLSKYDSWMPSWQGKGRWGNYYSTSKVFLMGVNKGKERKALHILQSLFTQLCATNDKRRYIAHSNRHPANAIYIDDFHEYDCEDDEDEDDEEEDDEDYDGDHLDDEDEDEDDDDDEDEDEDD